MTERDPASAQESTDALTGDTPVAAAPGAHADGPGQEARSATSASPSTEAAVETAEVSVGDLAAEPGSAPTTPRRGVGRSRAAKPLPPAVRPVRAPIKVVRKSVEQTAALRESLAEKEAEAHDLRVSIEQLRQELNAEREQLGATRRRPFPWAWVIAALPIVALVLWLLSMCSSGTASVAPSASPSATAGGASASPTAAASSPASSPSASSAATSAAPTTAAASSPAPSVAPSSPAAVTATTGPMRWAGTSVATPPGLPTSGPGIDAPGVDVSYALDADGTSVDVFERVRLASPQPSITAALPSLSALRGDLASAKLAVDGLQVELDTVAVKPALSGATWSAAKPDGTSVTSAVLRYRLTGAVVRLEPALPGRLAAVLTPLTAAGALGADQPVAVRVVGANVRSLTCPTAGAQIICGSATAKGATATLPKGSQPVLQLQFDRAS